MSYLEWMEKKYKEAEAKVKDSLNQYQAEIAALSPSKREKKVIFETKKTGGIAFTFEAARSVLDILPNEINHFYLGTGKAGDGTYYDISSSKLEPFWACPRIGTFSIVSHVRLAFTDLLVLNNAILEGYEDQSFDSPNLCRLTKAGTERLFLPEGMFMYGKDAAEYASILGYQGILNLSSNCECILLPNNCHDLRLDVLRYDVVFSEESLAKSLAAEFSAELHYIEKPYTTVTGCYIVLDIPATETERLSVFLNPLPRKPIVRGEARI